MGRNCSVNLLSTEDSTHDDTSLILMLFERTDNINISNEISIFFHNAIIINVIFRYKEFEMNAINTTWDLILNKVSSGISNNDIISAKNYFLKGVTPFSEFLKYKKRSNSFLFFFLKILMMFT